MEMIIEDDAEKRFVKKIANDIVYKKQLQDRIKDYTHEIGLYALQEKVAKEQELKELNSKMDAKQMLHASQSTDVTMGKN